MKPVVVSLGVALGLPCMVAGQLPALRLPEGVGVNIHFVTGHERDLDLIAAAGFRWVRMDFTWEAVERLRGEYDWRGYDELTRNLRRRGLRALFILDYSHHLYEESVQTTNPITGRPETNVASPRKPESVEAFARWAAAAAARYARQGVVWEIWNEPNIFFWRPHPNVDDYIRLARATCRAIRAAEPQAAIIAPGISGFDPPFMERFLASGILEYLDGVSVHPYRFRRPPESAAAEYRQLRQQVDAHTPAGRAEPIPIVSSEWGWSTDGKDVSPDTQAAFLVRQQLFNLSMGVPLSIWYDWKNDGRDPHEREHNFGVVDADLNPKPAYRAVQTLVRELAGYAVAGRFPLERGSDWVLVLTNDAGMTRLAAWSVEPPSTVTLQVEGKPPPEGWRVVAGDGQENRLPATSRGLTLELRALPQYVDLGKGRLLR
ncbi:cellulase family glycosylhydrolase [Limisphaera sp. 4302-co]|uniref:cellulase family glycosylhydrolase n=1 Tax=Limisphaera sp. 4302-co TaxID=3400417 RepID=UPI003C1F9CAA